MTANQRGQGARFVLGSCSIARYRACDSIARRMRESSSASCRITGGGFERSAANFAPRIRHQLDPRDTSSAYATSGFIGEWRAARGASRRVKKVENLAERGHI